MKGGDCSKKVSRIPLGSSRRTVQEYKAHSGKGNEFTEGRLAAEPRSLLSPHLTSVEGHLRPEGAQEATGN